MAQLKPSKIRYTQDSINNHFDRRGLHRQKLIGETLDDLIEGRINVDDIPKINVVKRNGEWFTVDNRRLWVLNI